MKAVSFDHKYFKIVVRFIETDNKSLESLLYLKSITFVKSVCFNTIYCQVLIEIMLYQTECCSNIIFTLLLIIYYIGTLFSILFN